MQKKAPERQFAKKVFAVNNKYETLEEVSNFKVSLQRNTRDNSKRCYPKERKTRKR